jgi:hypothetical protein
MTIVFVSFFPQLELSSLQAGDPAIEMFTLIIKALQMILLRILALISVLFSINVLATELQFEQSDKKRLPRYEFSFPEREHTFKQKLSHVGILYGLTWVVYPLSQPKEFFEEGSFKTYRQNFGKLTFDKDEPFWNWIMHPLTGSQLFLLYRAWGYSRMDAFKMTFISSTLFEMTVEIYTERSSVQDLFQTPVIGSILGLGLENLSFYLLNTGNTFGRFWGHVLNPATLMWFYEGRAVVTPTTNLRDQAGLQFVMEF